MLTCLTRMSFGGAPLLAELSTSSLFAMVLLLAASGLLMLRAQRYLGGSKRRGTAATRYDPAATAAARTPPKEVQSWQVETHELMREWTARLDNKIRLLEQLLCQADEKLARLEGQLSLPPDPPPAPAGSEPAPTTGASSAPPAAASSRLRRPVSQRQDEVYALADAGRSPADIATQLGSPVGEVELILALRGRHNPV